ncbi:CUB and zona pellucida-like domain-containing protein 1 isoform X2 [Xiphophorus maculatus]|uniref:CUB and zona pellucida-like domain-containing protein 1 isoform X2 n=1 Tax=Xiphophorus maculatus TaxID=8083 RepID=UPI000C6C8F92|nr:CUB and zona pellucida-like domain-containing protein 1 isoform X2 [Xiphophorus maculatus]
MKQLESWGNRFTMRALVFLCSVLITQGVQGSTATEGWTTPQTDYSAEAQPSCRYNCGYNMGSCSCSTSCQWNGNCCHDYYSYCGYTDTTAYPTTSQPSCRYNCGYNMGSCSCSTSCQWNGNCCHDYYSYCGYTDTTAYPTTSQPSCRYNCGYNMGSCSCSTSCQWNGNCCHDYYSYCGYTDTTAYPTTSQPSCRYNCGYNMGSCSCSTSCQWNGNCCHDYYSYCGYTDTTAYPTTSQPSCRYNCGYNMGSCSCSTSCQWNGNCCHDYYSYCGYTDTTAYPTTSQQSCENNCGSYLGSCSCQYSCQWNGNCCHDYYSYCGYTDTTAYPTTSQQSCENNCGSYLGSCSCQYSCQWNGNCCHDYYSYCEWTTEVPTTGPCGGSLFGSGTISSPNHPDYYNDNSYCVWQLRAAYDQRIFLAFSYLQLENCCSCDYISIYDGPYTSSPYLGKVCNNSLSTFYSTSNYMTVIFRSDRSVVGRGFRAEFMSSLKPSSGRVDCSSDNMNIVINLAYLNSLGYNGHSLYLDDPYCKPNISSYEVVFSFPLNSCGTVKHLNSGRVVYTNNIRGFPSSQGEIVRQSYLKMNVNCTMEPDSVSQIMFVVSNGGNSSITGSGRYNTSMAFYTSSSFSYKVTNVPYQVALNQDLYVQVDMSTHDSDLVLFLDTCVAAPSPFDFETRPYYLVRNGCSVDSTYRPISSGSWYRARFTFKAFMFLRGTDSVYLQCKALICPASESNSRCRRGCSRRKARELEPKHESQTLVMGPIQLKKSEEEKKEPEEQNEA